MLCKELALKSELTAERLRELLRYDPETGVFTRLVSLTLSKQYKAGDVAGGFDKSTGYIRISIENKRYWAHRLAWLYVHGKWPSVVIDHKNELGTDNRICNLREANKSQNGQNTKRGRSNNTSGFLGVAVDKKSGAWQASITVNGFQRSLGRFAKPEDASIAYQAAKAKFHPFAPCHQ